MANKMSDGEKYHFYQCLNGLIDVAVPIIINGEHVANLFSGQFFFEKPDLEFFKQQAKTFGFDEDKYLEALSRVPVFPREKVKTAMDFLLDMTQLISQLAYKKQVQQALNKQIIENEQLFKSVFESANAGKSITKLTGEINVNQAFCDMLGYTKKELQNKKWQDLTPADEVPAILTNLDPLLKGEKDSARFEKRYICKNGSWIWTDVSVSIRRDKNGKPLHFITTIIDISDRKQTREALQQAHDRLAKTVSTTVRHLTYSFSPITKRIELHQALEDIIVTIDKAVPLGLILTELISNAFKHAFPDERDGVISIELYASPPNKMILEISDNGIGIKDHRSIHEIKGMGLENVFNLVEHQLQGHLECVVDQGIRWRIILDYDVQEISRV